MESVLPFSSVKMFTLMNCLFCSSQTCLLNMTDLAIPMIFCMESSTDVINNGQMVSNTVCVCVCVCVCLYVYVGTLVMGHNDFHRLRKYNCDTAEWL